MGGKLFPVATGLWAASLVISPPIGISGIVFPFLFAILMGAFLVYYENPELLILFSLSLLLGVCSYFANRLVLALFFIASSVSFFLAPLIESELRAAISFVLSINCASLLANELIARTYPYLLPPELALMISLAVFRLLSRKVFRKRKAGSSAHNHSETPLQQASQSSVQQATELIDALIRSIATGEVSFSELSRLWTFEDREQPEDSMDSEQSGDQTGSQSEPPAEETPPQPGTYTNQHVARIHAGFVRPHITKDEFLRAIECLLQRLDAAADTPSVSFMDGNREALSDSYDVLRRVSLAEHTLNVVSEMHSLVRETFPDSWQITWPSAVTVAIGHDLGKAGVQQQGYTVYGEHQVQSAEIVFECTKNLQTQKLLSDVVRFHHGNTPDHLKDERLLELLKKADSAARRNEMAEAMGGMGSWKDVDIEDLCGVLLKLIEQEIKAGDPKRFSLCVDPEKGLVFITPALFIAALRDHTKTKNIFWPELLSRDETEVARACSELMKGKFSPAGLLPSGSFSPPAGGFYRFRRVELSGRGCGVRPFVILILSSFCRYAKAEPHQLVQLFRNSRLGEIAVS